MRLRPVSQYSAERLGLAIYRNSALTDSETDVTVKIETDGGTIIVQAGSVAVRDSEGVYHYQLSSALTRELGVYHVIWTFTIDSVEETFEDWYQVVTPMPNWDALDETGRQLVFNIYNKVADTFDSREGGPYLWELYQTRFNPFEVIARLMRTDAVNYINFTFQPAFSPPYTINDSASGKEFPISQWGGVLYQATYVEFLKHLSRSYIEIPDTPGVNVSHLDRRRYRAEWKQEAEDEKKTLDLQIRQFKRTFLVGARRSWLVGGGNVPYVYANPAQPHWQYAVARY